MRRKKLFVLIASVLALSCLLASCGKKDPASSSDSGDGKTYEFTLAHHHAVDSITDHMCHDFADLVAEKTNGAIQITVFPGGQMGSEQEVADGLLTGAQQFGMVTIGATFPDAVDGCGTDTLPFMFTSWDELNYAFNEATNPVGDALNKLVMAKGARVLNHVPCGGRQMIFVDKNITSYKQMKGMTMRSPESTLYTEMFKALGAAPTPITWSECYSALKTKVVEGMETPISSIRDMNFVEVTKYCLMTNHMWSTMNILVNNEVFDSLPADYQKAVQEAADEAGQNAFEEAKEAETEDIEYCREQGMIFNEMSEDESAEMAKLMEDMKAAWLEGHHPGRQEIYDLCLKAIDEFAKK